MDVWRLRVSKSVDSEVRACLCFPKGLSGKI